MSAFAAQIDDPAVIDTAAYAIQEAAGMIPHPIPYLGRVMDPACLKHVATAVRKGIIQVAWMVGPASSTAGYTDDRGPLILLPLDEQPTSIFFKSCAVHEAIHAAVDATGYGSPFLISRHTNEFIAHLGQTCYAIAKGADVTVGRFAQSCCKEAEPAARAFAKTGKVPLEAFRQLMTAIKDVYQDFPIKCNGWRVPNY